MAYAGCLGPPPSQLWTSSATSPSSTAAAPRSSCAGFPPPPSPRKRPPAAGAREAPPRRPSAAVSAGAPSEASRLHMEQRGLGSAGERLPQIRRRRVTACRCLHGGFRPRQRDAGSSSCAASLSPGSLQATEGNVSPSVPGPARCHPTPCRPSSHKDWRKGRNGIGRGRQGLKAALAISVTEGSTDGWTDAGGGGGGGDRALPVRRRGRPHD